MACGLGSQEVPPNALMAELYARASLVYRSLCDLPDFCYKSRILVRRPAAASCVPRPNASATEKPAPVSAKNYRTARAFRLMDVKVLSLNSDIENPEQVQPFFGFL